jgi:hypothetical protein
MMWRSADRPGAGSIGHGFLTVPFCNADVHSLPMSLASLGLCDMNWQCQCNITTRYAPQIALVRMSSAMCRVVNHGSFLLFSVMPD